MIEPRRTGAYISRLRKERNWTQMQLADQLNVTHQAVSRWETGDSFPDIATLSQIAEMFDIRVDDLLNGGPSQTGAPPRRAGVSTGNVIEELARGRIESIAEMLKEHPESFESVIEASPLTPPDVLKGVIDQMEGFTFNMEQIVSLAPFLDQQTLTELVEGQDGESLDAKKLVALAPFLASEAIDKYVDRVIEGTLSWDTVSALAPFLTTSALAGASTQFSKRETKKASG